MDNTRDFKGVWISREIWEDKDLTAVEKCLLAEIDSLDNKDHCYAKNEYFAEFLCTSIPTISRGIKKLISKGYIEVVVFTGRNRILKSTLGKPNQIDKAGESKRSGSVVKKIKPNNNPVNNTKEEDISEPPEAPRSPYPPKAQPKKKGDGRVSELIAYYHDKYVEYAGCKPTVTGGWGKNFKLLLRNHDQDQLAHIIDFFFDYDGRTQYSFYTFVNKVDNLAPMALKTMPKEDQSSSILLPGDAGYEEAKMTKYTGYQDVEGR